MASSSVTVEQYLTPIRELRYAVQYPTFKTSLSLSTLEALLFAHVRYLRTPHAPFGSPSAESKSQVESGKVKVPITSKQGKTSDLVIDLEETEKPFALEVSERLGISEVESAILCRRFKKDEAGLLDDMATTAASTTLQSSLLSKSGKFKPTRTQNMDTMALITKYYFQEVLAICDLLTALIRTASLDVDDVADLLQSDDEEGTMDIETRKVKVKTIAQDVLSQVIGGEQSAFIQNLFMDFAKAAQTPATVKYGKDIAKEWALHYLQIQTALLEALFIYVFWNSTSVMKADLSLGLIQGVLGSAFGAHQVNQRLIDMLPRTDTSFYIDKIQGLLGLVCIEASGLSSLQNGAIQMSDLSLGNIEATDPAQLHLLQSRNHIIELHQSLGEASSDCTSQEPFPLLLLSWASILSQLPGYLQPENQDSSDVPAFQRVATAALAPEFRLFERWSRMQSGALLRRPEYGAEDELDSVSYKETFHALLMALSTLVRASYVKNLDGLLEVWATLFGNGSSSSTAALCNLFWENAADNSSKGEILEAVNFPLYPLQSIKLLQSLAGMGSQEVPDDSWNPDEAGKAANFSYQWLNSTRHLTLVLPEDEDVDDNFRRVQEDNGSYARFARSDIELPGGLTIPSGSRGIELNRVNDKPIIIKWATSISGWHVLLSLMREAADLDLPSRHTWADFGVSVAPDALLAAGLSFISRLIVADPRLGRDLLDSNEDSRKDIVDIAFWTIGSRQIASSRDPLHTTLMTSALDLATSFVDIKSGRLWIEVQKAGVFPTNVQGNKSAAAQMIVDREAKSGDYPSTLCLLRLILAMTRNTINGQFETDYRFVHGKSDFLAAIVRFMHHSIWTRYAAWRYSHLTHQAEIGVLLCDIYNKIASGPSFLSSFTLDRTLHPLSGVNSVVLDKLIQNPSSFDFDPLFQVLTQPKRLLDSLQRHNRHAETFAIEKTLLHGLSLATTLIRVASQIYRNGTGLPTILSMAFSASAGADAKEHYHLVNILFDYIFSSTFQFATATAAAGLLNQLAAVPSAEDGSLSLLPCLREPRKISRDLQSVLQDMARPVALRRELWSLLVTASQNQTGFASLCLDPRSIFIYGPGASTETHSDTILNDVIDMIVDWRSSWDSDATSLLSPMRIMEIVYTEHPQIAAVGTCGDHVKLWDSIYEMAAEPQATAPLISIQLLNDEDDRTSLVKDVVRYSARRRIRSSAIRIFGAILERLDPVEVTESRNAAEKAAFRLINEADDYRLVVAEAGQNSCQPLAMSDNLANIQKRLLHCDIQQLTSPAYDDSLNFGENYNFSESTIKYIAIVPDVELIVKVSLDIDAIGSTIDDVTLAATVTKQLVAVNLYWSEMKADTSFSAAVDLLTNNAIAFAAQSSITASAAKAVQGIILESSREDRAGDFMLAVQMERCHIVESLLQTVWRGEWTSDASWLIDCVESLSMLCDHPIFSPTTLAKTTDAYLQTTILDSSVYLLSVAHSNLAWADNKVLARLRPALRRIATFVTEILSDIMLTLTTTATSVLLENADKVNAIYDMFASDERLFGILVHILDEHGIVKRSCEIVSQLDLSSASHRDHIKIYRILLELHRVIGQTATGAGRLSAADTLWTYSGSSLTEMASTQRIGRADTLELQGLWSKMLSNIALMLRNLPYITQIVTAEVLPFLNRVNPRLRSAMEWELHGESSLAGLSELVALLEILQHVVAVVADDVEVKMSTLNDYAIPLLRLLRSVTNAINKPNLVHTYLEHGIDEDLRLNSVSVSSVIDNETLSILHCLIGAADIIIVILRDLTYAMPVIRRSTDANILAPSCVLPSLSTDSSAVKILLDMDSALQDVDLAQFKNKAIARGGSSRIFGLPVLSEEIVKENIARTREYGLIVTVVQAVTRHERDLAEEQVEKMESERKKADSSGDSLLAIAEEKKVKAGRRRARQDLRDVNERIRRTISTEKSQVAQICSDFLTERGGDLSSW
ncbi:hypothetical protein QFC22_002220 [Naganishia vaughanmartiniae]|uniref:Uncharacterized protein n=1 Tax=Naganishia vaughanmartiniae TaxID=1424756 RepID=A0ACC2XEY0_9TREE|nr:hypothetical protein QFC22_002220 [Naganishia vaughanmartiniae]